MEPVTWLDHGEKIDGRWPRRAGGRGLAAFIGLALLLGLMPKIYAVEVSNARVTMPGSIRAVPTTPPVGASVMSPHITRANLQQSELNAPMPFEVSLKMRNFAELEARLANGELISPAEMAAKYWPLQSDYDDAADWLKQQGFTVSTANPSHLLISATGTVAQVQSVFQVNFARVTSDGQEFSSAVTAPSVPASLAPSLVGVNGLQPHIRKHPNLVRPADATGFKSPYYPNQIKQAYGANTLTVDGTGQTIAIIMSAFPGGNLSTITDKTNLQSFWTTTGITRTGTYTAFAVGSGPTASSNTTAAEEVCLDVEWSSSIAPGANIRVYGTSSLADTDTDQAYTQVYNDAIKNPEFGLHVMSMSYGGGESSSAQLTTDTQLFAQLISAGITPFASSGDNGSLNAAASDGGTLGPDYPASDPNVTGVGGTSITMNTTTGVVTSETTWNNGFGSSGGGSSGFFAKPSWQTGNGVSGSISSREVPDVSAPADPNTGAFIWYNGASTIVGGTSWSSPTWAGFSALINQARANNHEQPLGFLNPRIYPLLGTSAFRDITSGNNGAYNAGPGYDMVTGLGVPVFPDLLNQLTTIIELPINVEVDAGQNAVFNLLATNSVTSFQWQRMAANSATWANLTDNATYSGSVTATLTINAATAAMSGDQFRCIAGAITVPPVTLVVIPQPLYVTTLAGQAGTSGVSNGQGTAAQFNMPNDVALDANGNILVADTANNGVRKITPAGNVTTIAGNLGIAGYVNGNVSANVSAAEFDFINSIDLDAGGNIYLADSTNNAIRKITPAGVVTTFAGSSPANGGVAGFSNGNVSNGTAALLNFPAGLTVATNGNLYIADSNNNAIRVITSTGNVSTLAGNSTVSHGVRTGVAGFANGNGTTAEFNFPAAVAVDSTGNIFVADANNNVIRKITAAGNVTTFAGTAGVEGVADGTGSFAQFNYPSGIAVDSANNIYVTDTNNNSIRKITQAGVVTTIAGQAGIEGHADGVGSAAQFNQPYGLVINNSTGVIYIADTVNHTIREVQVLNAPQIQSQSGNLIVLAGNVANFSVTANGVPPPTFQWQYLPAGGSTWSNLTDDATYNGSVTANLTVNAMTVDMDGDQYQCLITNAAGNITSVPALLTVQQAPQFTTQPTDQAVNVGDTASFTVAATGLPDVITYQWQSNSGAGWGNLSDNATITGSNTTTLNIGPVSTTLGGTQFRAVATNGVSPDATSNAANLTVYPSGYQAWASGLNLSGASAQLSVPSFGGTIPNLVRFAMNLGASPTSDQLPTLSTQVINGTSYLTLSYNVNKNLSGEQVVAQYSTDLQTWQSVTAVGNTVQLADPNSQTSRFQAQVAIPTSGTIFLRVVIQPLP